MAERIKISDLQESDRLVPDSFIQVYRHGDKVVKLCDPPQLSEAQTMRYVRQNTSLPVPEIYDAYIGESSGRGIIIMEYVKGDVLRDVWEHLTSEQQSTILCQLERHLTELRSIKGHLIGPIDGSPCYDPIFSEDSGEFGPFKSEAEFNEGLVKAMKLFQENTWVDQAAKFVRAIPPHGIVLTHGDLSPRNILIRGDQIVAILDWEFARFYPEYWEYVKALFYPDWQSEWIMSGSVDKILRPCWTDRMINIFCPVLEQNKLTSYTSYQVSRI